jgi:adenosine deaminase
MTADLKGLPKAVLHEHLDGGLRPETVLELADSQGYTLLPADDPAELAAWFHQDASGSLERYLDAFDHTVGVMQTQEALERVAYENVIDLAADHAVYAEIRFGPSLHTRRGLRREGVIEATLAGLARGRAETGMSVWLIADALRNEDDSVEVARAAGRFAGRGMVGFDLSGPEAGYPADLHLEACRVAKEAGLALTIHAGEGDGVHSIWLALDRCHAQRLGHGVRIIEDTRSEDGQIVELGPVARQVRDWRIPLEVCPTSNVHTGLAPDPASHPIRRLFDSGFRVTINTDNRLMSNISLASEYQLAKDVHGFSIRELGGITADTIAAGFGDWAERRQLIDAVVHPAYAAASD